jgi:hypothetical protein
VNSWRAPDPETNYATPVPQQRYRKYRTVEEEFDHSEEAKRMQRQHLFEEGWESFGGARS